MIPVIKNTTPFVMQAYEKWDNKGNEFDVIVLRGTFDMLPNETMLALAEQTPINFGDEHSVPINGDVFYSQLEREGDLILGKRSTDVCIKGISYCPKDAAGHSLPSWDASVQIGDHQKTLIITGPRSFIKDGDRWSISDPEPVTAVVLDYRHAFGGHVPVDAQHELQDRYVAYPFNPIGQGWLPTDDELSHYSAKEQSAIKSWRDSQIKIAAPQIMDQQKQVFDPYDRLPPAGVSPIARWWQPRRGLQGTLDQAWLKQRHPYPPDDFDERFYQCANPDLITQSYLQGAEHVRLSNVGWITDYHGRLPGISMHGLAKMEGGKQHLLPMVLDTLRIDTSVQKTVLLWRLALLKSRLVKSITLMGYSQKIDSAVQKGY